MSGTSNGFVFQDAVSREHSKGLKISVIQCPGLLPLLPRWRARGIDVDVQHVNLGHRLEHGASPTYAQR